MIDIHHNKLCVPGSAFVQVHQAFCLAIGVKISSRSKEYQGSSARFDGHVVHIAGDYGKPIVRILGKRNAVSELQVFSGINACMHDTKSAKRKQVGACLYATEALLQRVLVKIADL